MDAIARLEKFMKYVSDNGYSGILYSRSSMIVYDPEGKEVFHTRNRTIESEAELKEFVDDFPNKRPSMLKLFEELSK